MCTWFGVFCCYSFRFIFFFFSFIWVVKVVRSRIKFNNHLKCKSCVGWRRHLTLPSELKILVCNDVDMYIGLACVYIFRAPFHVLTAIGYLILIEHKENYAMARGKWLFHFHLIFFFFLILVLNFYSTLFFNVYTWYFPSFS